MKITLQRTSPNYRRKLSTHGIMRDLTIGLLVIVGFSLYFQWANYQTNDGLIKAALIYVTSVGVALATEVVWALIQKKNILEHLKNSFPLVTALIFALTLPIGTPLYVVAIGSFIAIFFGKLVYGGFGQNIFNPALVGRVVVHLSFGAQLTTFLDAGTASDIVSGATPATWLASTSWLGAENLMFSLQDLLFGSHGGALGETCVLLILVVGIVLAYRKVFDYRIPASYLLTVLVLGGAFALATGQNVLSYALIQLSIGGVVFGAIFMATDPVTSPTSPMGKIIFGIGLGFITMIIRFKANFPEGVLFSILIMNMLTPFIDSMILGRTDTFKVKRWLTIGLIAVVATGCTYGVGRSIETDVRNAEEQARLEAEEEAKRQEEEEANKVKWTLLEKIDGGYIMEAYGFGGKGNPMKVQVMISGDQISSVTVLEYPGETAYYGEDLIQSGVGGDLNSNAKVFYDFIFGGSFSAADLDGVDVATGATKTAEAIVNAIKGAIEEAQKAPVVNGDEYTYTLSAAGFNAGNPMTIKVTLNVKTSTVTQVEVVSYAGETAYYGEDLIQSGVGGDLNSNGKVFYDTVFGGNLSFSDVDGIDVSTGATKTAAGIKEAIQNAIADER